MVVDHDIARSGRGSGSRYGAGVAPGQDLNAANETISVQTAQEKDLVPAGRSYLMNDGLPGLFRDPLLDRCSGTLACFQNSDLSELSLTGKPDPA